MGDMDSTVVITGAASGLGREIAVALLHRKRPVILLDRDPQTLAATGRELSERWSDSVSMVVADLSTPDGVYGAAHELADRPDLGGLVNNAGGWLPGDQYPEAAPQTWLSALTLNLVAPMLLTQLLWDRLAANEGAVVNIGSSGGIGDDAYGSPEYGAAKAGLRRFTTSLASHSDVRVMAVVPGWIGLERARGEWTALTPEQQNEIGPLIPPADIAAKVSSLLSDGQSGEVVEVLHRDTQSSTSDH